MALLDIRQRSGSLFLIVTLGQILLISAQVNAKTGVPILEAVRQSGKPLLVIGCLTAFAVALDPLGFLLSSIPLLLLLLRVIDPVRWTLAIPIAVFAPLGVWWVLKRLLLIQLPSGIFEIG